MMVALPMAVISQPAILVAKNVPGLRVSMKNAFLAPSQKVKPPTAICTYAFSETNLTQASRHQMQHLMHQMAALATGFDCESFSCCLAKNSKMNFNIVTMAISMAPKASEPECVLRAHFMDLLTAVACAGESEPYACVKYQRAHTEAITNCMTAMKKAMIQKKPKRKTQNIQ